MKLTNPENIYLDSRRTTVLANQMLLCCFTNHQQMLLCIGCYRNLHLISQITSSHCNRYQAKKTVQPICGRQLQFNSNVLEKASLAIFSDCMQPLFLFLWQVTSKWNKNPSQCTSTSSSAYESFLNHQYIQNQCIDVIQSNPVYRLVTGKKVG